MWRSLWWHQKEDPLVPIRFQGLPTCAVFCFFCLLVLCQFNPNHHLRNISCRRNTKFNGLFSLWFQTWFYISKLKKSKRFLILTKNILYTCTCTYWCIIRFVLNYCYFLLDYYCNFLRKGFIIVRFVGPMSLSTQGALESIFAAALCGVIYALTAAQPLAILGFTGPVLVFEKILYDLCRYEIFLEHDYIWKNFLLVW